MKPFFFLLSLFSLSSFAQLPTVPVIDNRPLTTYHSLDDMIEAEGQRIFYGVTDISKAVSGTVVTSVAATTANSGYVRYYVGGVTWGQAVLQYGFAHKLIEYTVGINHYQANGKVTFSPRPNTNYLATSGGSGVWHVGSGGGSYTVPGGGYASRDRFGPASTIDYVTRPWSGTVAPTIGTVESFTLTGSAGYSIKRFTDDRNFSAPYVVEFIGDSEIEGYNNTTVSKDMFATYATNYWRDKGYDVRRRNLSVTGSIAQQHELEQTLGGYVFPAKPALSFIELGTNNTTDVPDSVANSVSRIALRQAAQSPSTIVVVLALLPRNDANNNQMTLISNATQAKIAALGNSRILFCPAPQSAFVSTNSSMYLDGLHTSITGTLAWWNGVKAWLATNVPTLPRPY